MRVEVADDVAETEAVKVAVLVRDVDAVFDDVSDELDVKVVDAVRVDVTVVVDVKEVDALIVAVPDDVAVTVFDALTVDVIEHEDVWLTEPTQPGAGTRDASSTSFVTSGEYQSCGERGTGEGLLLEKI